jgi:hypothetical protein
MARTSARLKPTSAAMAAVLLTSLVSVVATAGQAAAASEIAYAQRTSLAYTDSLAPKQSFQNPADNLPVGSWTNTGGATHVSRVYASFDLAAFTGKDVLTATVFASESKVTQCQARSLEVWQTKTPTYQVTWNHAPDGETLLGTIKGSSYCPADYMHLDLTAAIHDAVAKHRPNFSVALQLPAADETNLSLGRWLSGSAGVRLAVTYNTPPAKPTELFNDGRPCATSKPYPYLSDTYPRLEAIFSDSDPGDVLLKGDFAVWPANDPGNRTEFSATVGNGYEGGISPPTGVLTDGGTYAWQARTDDGTDQSAWSKPCYFTVDATAPSAEPTVLSANYPENQQSPGGVVPTFTLSANGVKDVVAYQFSWMQDFGVLGVYGIGPKGVPQWTDPLNRPDVIRADKLGGSATLTAMPPLSGGPVRLYVRSIDRALNVSQPYMYQFFVRQTYPTVTMSTQTPKYGTPVTLTFAPNAALTGVDSYTYEIDSYFPGPSHTVTAGADGTASVTVALNAGPNWIRVTSHSANGWVSDSNVIYEYVDTSPTVTADVYLEDNGTGASAGNAHGGVGVPGVFTFTSKVSGVVSFTYSIDWGPGVTIPAGANGVAQLTYTPDTNGYHEVDVYATAADGTVFDTYYYAFYVS